MSFIHTFQKSLVFKAIFKIQSDFFLRVLKSQHGCSHGHNKAERLNPRPLPPRGKGIEAILSDGTVLCGNRSLLESQKVDLDGYKNDHYGTEVLLALDGKFIGYLVISDTIKADAVDAIAKIKRLGIRTAMLTAGKRLPSSAPRWLLCWRRQSVPGYPCTS